MNPQYQGYGVGVAQMSAWGQEAAMTKGAALMEEVRREAARMTGQVDELSGLLSKCTIEEDSSSPVSMQSTIRGDIQCRSCTERSLARVQRTMGEHGHIQSRSSSTELWTLPGMQSTVWQHGDIQSAPERSLIRVQTTVGQHGHTQSETLFELAVERYEDNLSLLLQEFVAKARHQRVLTGRWPSDNVEDTAVLLSERLDGIEWQRAKSRSGYLRELDEAWMRDRYTRKEKVFQVIWDYVGGIARKWDGFSFPRKEVWMNENREKEGRWEWEYALMSTRHEKCHNTKSKLGNPPCICRAFPRLCERAKALQ